MKKNFLAIFLGFFISFLMLGLGEAFFRLNEKRGWISKVPRTSNREPRRSMDKEKSLELKEKIQMAPVFQWQPRLTEEEGERIKEEGIDKSERGPLSCCVIAQTFSHGHFISRIKSRRTHKIIYEAAFKFDQFSRRVTPDPIELSQEILMLGDSFTMGEGVNDQESSPYQLGLMRPRSKIMNLGISGGAPNQFLYEIGSSSVRFQELKSSNKVAVYTFTDEQVERLICRSVCLNIKNEWMQMQPYYYKKDGQIVFGGTFQAGRPFKNWIYNLANESALLRFFDVVIPPRFTKSDYLFFADVVLELQKKLNARLGKIDFYVAFIPFGSRRLAPALVEALNERGVKYLDYSDINAYTITGGRHVIPGDGHPTPISQYIYAYLLNRDLPGPM